MDAVAENRPQRFSFRNFFTKLAAVGKENTANLTADQLSDLSHKYSEKAYQTAGWTGLSTWMTVVGAGATVLTGEPLAFAITLAAGGSALAEGALAERRKELSDRFTKMAQKLRFQDDKQYNAVVK